MTELPTLLDSREAAAVVRMHRLTLLRKAREGLIGSVRSGNRVYFYPEHLADYLANGETKPIAQHAPKPSRNPRYSK